MKSYEFALKLPSEDQYFAEALIKQFCEKNFLRIKYYRQASHPLLREVKVLGNQNRIKALEKFLHDISLDEFVIEDFKEANRIAWEKLKSKYSPEIKAKFEKDNNITLP